MPKTFEDQSHELEVLAPNFSNALALLGIERIGFVTDPEKTIGKATAAIEQMGYHNDTAFYANFLGELVSEYTHFANDETQFKIIWAISPKHFDVERQLYGVIRMVSSILKHMNTFEVQEN